MSVCAKGLRRTATFVLGQTAGLESAWRRVSLLISARGIKRRTSVPAEECDYVIVGAGSAGCVLANRLTEDGDSHVTLLEAGGKDTSWKFRMPAALMYTLKDSKVNWCYYTTPQKHLNDRELYWPRAKVWGGCSSHNAMVFLRGHPYDYDRWEREGAVGWSYKDCLPYFKKLETFGPGGDEYRGDSGPLHVTRNITSNPLFDAFVEAGQQAGYPLTSDINGYQQEGFGFFDMSIKDGVRTSTSTAYLHPILQRKNLAVQSNAIVSKILFSGTKATGVEYFSAKDSRKEVKTLHARKEVILCGGAINTPQLLMLSGVGNADSLKLLGINVVADLPGVGQNLQDHLEVYVQYKCTQPLSLYEYQWKFPLKMIRTGVKWFLFKTGAASSAHLEVGAFIRSQSHFDHPDLQLHFLPSVVIDHGQSLGNCHAFQAHVGTMRPKSTGSVTLQSTDPTIPPLMDPNYLAVKEDLEDFRDCIRLSREIFAQKAFDRFRGDELLPGKFFVTNRQIDDFVRACGESAYHPSGTCRMGLPNDQRSVVDSDCRVIGFDNLRVVDASVMPSLPSSNINAPVIMIAEKAADIIRKKAPLPPQLSSVYQPTNLQSQR